MIKRLAGTAIFLTMLSVVSAAGQDLPKPDLRFVRATDTEVNGKPYRMYEIEIVNRADFSDELFVQSPNLPPCGRNTNSSRTWINIYIDNKNRIYGHCGISSNGELSSLKFNVSADIKLTKISVDFVDRREGKVVHSNTVDVEN